MTGAAIAYSGDCDRDESKLGEVRFPARDAVVVHVCGRDDGCDG